MELSLNLFIYDTRHLSEEIDEKINQLVKVVNLHHFG